MVLSHLWYRPIISNHVQHVIKSSLHRKLGSEVNLKNIISEKILASQLATKNFRKNYGICKVCDITVDMIYDGMHNIPCLVCETTSCDEDKGICLQGYSIPECFKLLTKAKIGSQPMPESLFWLLMTGDVPTGFQTESISKEWVNRACIQPHVVTMINNFPLNLHPMTQLSAAITTLSCKSRLRQAYISGVHKINYWEYVYEDAMDLIACLPSIVALIYKKYMSKTQFAESIKDNDDWCANFAKNLGYSSSDFSDFLRLYICFGHDSDGGNVSMHTAHIVASALSDPYLAFASSLNLLAGPLISNEKSILFLKNIHSCVGSEPSDEKLSEFLMNAMDKSKPTMAGFHNSLDSDKAFYTDHRFAYFQEFGNKHLPEDPLFKVATQLARLGYHNLVTVDVLAGIFFEFYKVNTIFHPVMMSLSHLIRITSSLVWDRALGYPIEHPISMSTSCLMKACKLHDMPGQQLQGILQHHTISPSST